MRRRWPVALLVLLGCGDPAGYDWNLPPGFPEPAVPGDNPMSAAKVTLGQRLFFDSRLSGNGTISCATCHEPAKAFSDGKVLPQGSTGQTVPRNAPSLTNVAYYGTLGWGNPTLTTLEKQALVPMFGETPVEMGITGNEATVLARFRDDPELAAMFAEAFPDEREPVSFDSIVKAIASYERTLIAGNAPYDRWVAGDEAALSASAKRGMDLFFSERLECYHCHAGPNFTTSFRSAESRLPSLDFNNNGLYSLGGTGAYPGDNVGLYEFTNEPTDMGKMRVPSLRNVALTAPYMHDGSIATLGAVIDHYAAGGRNIADGPLAGDGRASPYKSPLVRGFPITADEKADVLAFLESLTDVDSLTARGP